jgi:UDP-N-acetylglucosamine 1-carboxyvinyltransferase
VEKEPILEITGKRRLSGGRVTVDGSSNQVTKCIVASMLTNERVVIKNAPYVNERKAVEELFVSLGGEITHHDRNVVEFSGKSLSQNHISREICRKNRISILALGPLLHRFKEATLYGTLGGDKIGKRPVDFHLKGFEEMGACLEIEDDLYHITVGPEGLQGAHIVLPFPSVMTTENLIIAATLAKGRTIIENAAIEPEVIELVKMLQKMGADIMVNAHRTFIIQGVKELKGCEITIMPDRNQAVSFACAALATGGDVLLEHMPHDPLYSFLNFIQRMGASFNVDDKGIFIESPSVGRLKHTHVEVEVHPGFMTDWQQQFSVLFTQAEGVSILHETIFENRLGYVEYLKQMGANITIFSSCLGEAPCRFKNKNHFHSALIQGPTPLKAAHFRIPTDIRAGMCQVIAALVAEGTSTLTNIAELQRKYDKLVEKLQSMGADIRLTSAH